MSRDEYPENKAYEVWPFEECTCILVFNDKMRHWCGYTRFPRRPVQEDGYDGFLIYVPVYGGITYSRESPDGSMVYGFDCGHANDDTYAETHDTVWVKEQTEHMVIGLKLARDFEAAYLQAKDNKEKIPVIEAYHKLLKERGIEFEGNFLFHLNILAGKL